MKIYLAGPMRGIKDFNFPAFHEAARALREQGHEVFSPAEKDEEMHDAYTFKSTTGDMADLDGSTFNIRDAIIMDLDWISHHAEAIALLPGWENSSGARCEYALADMLKLQVIRVGNHEERITDSVTGGQKGRKLERFDLIPVYPLEELARVYGQGAKKYDDDNWRKGYSWRLSFGAMMRHAWKFWRGESVDHETGCHHLAQAAWHCFTLMWFEKNRPEKDDRGDSISK